MRLRARGEAVRNFILENIERHPAEISRITAEKFHITRQAVNKHLHLLVSEKTLLEDGNTRTRSYKLAPLVETRKFYEISPDLHEDIVWRNEVVTELGALPENVRDIWNYGFTEMFNNAIEHSEGTRIAVLIRKTASSTEIVIYDDGVGIFKKIQTQNNLLDEAHAILELHKGKLTTDPDHHTGEGIFFTSRILDTFNIFSGETVYSHEAQHPNIEWILPGQPRTTGTAIWMKLSNHTSKKLRNIFDQFTTGDEDQFNKTLIPLKLAQYENDKLVSRSQAKRVLARVELFKVVLLDFTGVPLIGQAFADEIFRVFAQAHPEIELQAIHENEEVAEMIRRAKSSVP